MNGSRHILIVDDNVEFAGMAAEAVRDVSDQFEVRVATSAEAAIAEIQGTQDSARSYDLVITDIKMPGSSGLQLIKTLAEIAPETKTITMTAYHSPELAEQAEKLQVCAYLIKPIALSEFRQVVRAALPSIQAGADASAPSRQLPAAQRTAVERQLANLRSITNSMTALLAHVDGTILAADRLDKDTDAGALCEALIDSMQTIAQAMRRALNTDAPIQQSYYGTEAFSICTYRMDRSHVIVTVFGSTVREGHVWYCMREAAKELTSTLTSKGDDETSLRAQAGDAWRAKMEQYFSETPMQRARKRRTAPPVEQPAATSRRDADPPSHLPSAELARPSLDQTDGGILSDKNWDSAISDTGREPEGTSLQEAQNRGSFSPQPSDSSPQIADLPPVEDIDWDVPADLDWDTLVANTDQGFAGMDFEEAKRRGLVDDIESG